MRILVHSDVMAESKETEKKKTSGKKVAQTIVRISGKDIDGSYNLERALVEIKGIGRILAHAMTHSINTKFGIDNVTNIGSMSDEQIKNISSVIENPTEYGIPAYMLNNRKYIENGNDVHIVGPDLTYAVRQQIARDISNRTWRGHRHQNHLTVRGQRLHHSTGKSKTPIGVSKKKAQRSKSASAPAKKSK